MCEGATINAFIAKWTVVSTTVNTIDETIIGMGVGEFWVICWFMTVMKWDIMHLQENKSSWFFKFFDEEKAINGLKLIKIQYNLYIYIYKSACPA